jgi:group I intron endonuclease
MKSGIYKIVNKENGKIYIGSSYDIEGRWWDHKSLLRNNKHHSKHLQRAWNKHEEHMFSFEIIENCKIDELFEREQFYLDTLLKAQTYINGSDDYFLKNGYNMKPVAESGRGFKHSQETIDKIKSKCFKKVIAVNINGKQLGTFQTTGEAAKFFNIAINRVQLSVNNKKVIKDNIFGFIYEKDYYKGYKPKIIVAWMKGTKGVLKNPNKSPVYVYDSLGNFIEKIDSQLECSKKYNIRPSNLNRSINDDIRLEELSKRKRKFFFRKNFEEDAIIIIRNSNK